MELTTCKDSHEFVEVFDEIVDIAESIVAAADRCPPDDTAKVIEAGKCRKKVWAGIYCKKCGVQITKAK